MEHDKIMELIREDRRDEWKRRVMRELDTRGAGWDGWDIWDILESTDLTSQLNLGKSYPSLSTLEKERVDAFVGKVKARISSGDSTISIEENRNYLLLTKTRTAVRGMQGPPAEGEDIGEIMRGDENLGALARLAIRNMYLKRENGLMVVAFFYKPFNESKSIDVPEFKHYEETFFYMCRIRSQNHQ